MLATCTKGPSFPIGIPLPRDIVRPIVLEMRVLKDRYSWSLTPRMIVFISGMPLPTALGSTRWTKPVAKVMNMRGYNTHTAYCAQTLPL